MASAPGSVVGSFTITEFGTTGSAEVRWDACELAHEPLTNPDRLDAGGVHGPPHHLGQPAIVDLVERSWHVTHVVSLAGDAGINYWW